MCVEGEEGEGNSSFAPFDGRSVELVERVAAPSTSLGVCGVDSVTCVAGSLSPFSI